MAGKPRAEAEVRAGSRKLDPDLRRARARFKKFGAKVKRDLSSSFAGVRSAIRGALAFGGVAGAAAIGRDVFQFEKSLERLRIQAGESRQTFGDFRGELNKVSKETGVSRNELVEAAAAFTAFTGEFGTVRADMGTLAKVSKATGATMEDVAASAGAMVLNIKDFDEKDFAPVFDALVAQGNAGSITLAEIGSNFKALAPLTKRFGDAGAQAAADLGLLFQATATGFKSADETTTGLAGLLDVLPKAARQLKVKDTILDPKTGKKRKKTIRELLADVESKRKKKGLRVDQIISEKRARRAFEAIQEQVGPLEQKIADLGEVTGTVDRQFKAFSESTVGKMEKAFNLLRTRLAEAMTPERIEKFVAAMEKLVDVLIFAVDNAGQLVALFAGAKFARGGLALSSIAAQAAKGGSAFGAAASAMGKLGAAAGVVAAGIAGIQIAFAALNNALEKDIAAKAGTAFVRDRLASEFGLGKRLAGAAGAGPTEAQKRAGRSVLTQGRATGIVDAAGNVVESKVREIAQQNLEASGLNPLQVRARLESEAKVVREQIEQAMTVGANSITEAIIAGINADAARAGRGGGGGVAVAVVDEKNRSVGNERSQRKKKRRAQ